MSILVPDDISRGYGYRIFGGSKIIFHAISYFLLACFVLAVYGVWVVRRRIREYIFLLLPVIYFSLTHMFILAEARFTLPARPFLLIFTAIGIAAIINKLRPGSTIPLYPPVVEKIAQ